jgi:hypothetical protein
VGQKVEVLVEGPSEETELLIQGRMATQAQEIDGHVLINDLNEITGPEGSDLKAGDLIEVEITEAMPHSLLGTATRFISRGKFKLGVPSSAETSAATEWRESNHSSGYSSGLRSDVATEATPEEVAN